MAIHTAKVRVTFNNANTPACEVGLLLTPEQAASRRPVWCIVTEILEREGVRHEALQYDFLIDSVRSIELLGVETVLEG
jgi:hypothetical protein